MPAKIKDADPAIEYLDNPHVDEGSRRDIEEEIMAAVDDDLTADYEDFSETQSIRERVLSMLDSEVVSKKEGIVRYPANVNNLRRILRHDPRFAGKLGVNVRNDSKSFTSNVDFEAPGIAPVRLQGGEPEILQNHHISRFIAFFGESFTDGGYGLSNPKRTEVDTAVEVQCYNNEFDPVREMFEKAHAGWDGQRGRMEKLFVNFLGVEDNDYHREAAVIFMTGMVMRTMEPGCPFKHLLVLQAPGEDMGKTGFLELISGRHYKVIGSDTMKTIKGISEEMRGPAVVNFDEFVAFKNMTFAEANMAIELKAADARVSFGRAAEKYRMRHVPAATTNQLQLLDSPNLDSGSRYVIIRIGKQYDRFNRIDFKGLKAEIRQIWGEAMQHYLDLCAERERQRLEDADHENGEDDGWEGSNRDYIHLKFSEEAEKFRMKLTRAARIESGATLLTGRIDALLTTPVGKLGDQHVERWVRSKDYTTFEGNVYRLAWFRPAIFDQIVREPGITEEEVKMIRAEEAKTGRNSPFTKTIDELTYIEASGVSKPVRGLEAFRSNNVFRIDRDALIARISELREVAERDEEEEMPF